GPADSDLHRSTGESAVRVSEQPAELHSVQYGLHRVTELPVAPFVQAHWHNLLLRPVLYRGVEQCVENIVHRLGLSRDQRPQFTGRHHHQQSPAQLFVQYHRQPDLASPWDERVSGRGNCRPGGDGAVDPTYRSVQTLQTHAEGPQYDWL